MNKERNTFVSPNGNYEIWEEKPEGYFTIDEWKEAHPEPVPPPPTLEEVKALKIKEINEMRDMLEQAGFEFKGSYFDSDQISYMRLLGASQTAQTALATGQAFSIDWTLSDNTTRTMTAQDMIGIIPAFAMYSNQLHEDASFIKSKIEDAQTIEEVEAIIWEI